MIPVRAAVLCASVALVVVALGCGGDETTTVTETVTVQATDATTTEATETTTETEDVVTDCEDFTFNITRISVRNIECDKALGLMERELGSVSESFELGSFQCDLIEGIELSGIWRCVDGDRAIRFAFGD